MPTEDVPITMPYLWWSGLAHLIGPGSPLVYSQISKVLRSVTLDGRTRESDLYTVRLPEHIWVRLIRKCAASESPAHVLTARSLRKVLREQHARDFFEANTVRIPLEQM